MDSGTHFTLHKACFSFTLEAARAALLPPYKGSTLRGGLGQAFRQLACLQPGGACQGCPVAASCAYAYIFETSRGNTRVTLDQEYLPHPYVIECLDGGQARYGPGETLEFNLHLLGRGIEFLPYFTLAFQQAARKGLGAGRHPFAMKKAEQVLGEEKRLIWREGMRLTGVPHREALDNREREGDHLLDRVTLELVTPLRLQRGGRLVKELDFRTLLHSVLLRLSFVVEAHQSGPLGLDFKGMLGRAQGVEAAGSSLAWQDWTRYSSRQGKKIIMGGLVGEITFRGGPLGEFLPYLRLAEQVHTGKGTVYGLGKIKVREA